MGEIMGMHWHTAPPKGGRYNPRTMASTVRPGGRHQCILAELTVERMHPHPALSRERERVAKGRVRVAAST